MSRDISGLLHAYLAGVGKDSRGRLAADVLGFSDEQLEEVHDYIQWLFPLPTRSGAQPDSPVLTEEDIEAIRADHREAATLEHATDRLIRFHRNTSGWLRGQDH